MVQDCLRCKTCTLSHRTLLNKPPIIHIHPFPASRVTLPARLLQPPMGPSPLSALPHPPPATEELTWKQSLGASQTETTLKIKPQSEPMCVSKILALPSWPCVYIFV